jgi:predicted nucleotidyltransferase
MIRDGRKLPEGVTGKIPSLVKAISRDSEIAALYIFGSLAEGNLRPLSDLDFGVLLSASLDRRRRGEKHLDLIGLFNDMLQTDEIDLVVMNDAPPRFSHRILKTGRLLHAGDRDQLADFYERTVRRYLDFKPVRTRFVDAFLKGVGFNG